MSTNNSVFKVLVTSGNKAVIAKDKYVTELTPGQIGVFDFRTNLSVDATSKVKNFYLALGVDSGDGTTIGDIKKSSGSHIQDYNVNYYTYRPYQAGLPMKVKLKDFIADCETTYGVKFNLSNGEHMFLNGFSPKYKTYLVTTSCCDECEETCPSGDANEITKQLLEQVNSDPKYGITAVATARGAVTKIGAGVDADLADGDELVEGDLEAIMAFNAAQADVEDYIYTDIVFTADVGKFYRNCNFGFTGFPRETSMQVSKVGDFKCAGEVEVIQNVRYEQGNGQDLAELEYVAIGWETDPYRTGAITGFVNNNGISLVNAGAKYDQLYLKSVQKSRGTWDFYEHNIQTIVAVPTADTTTSQALLTVLDAIMIKFDYDALKDDATAFDMEDHLKDGNA